MLWPKHQRRQTCAIRQMTHMQHTCCCKSGNASLPTIPHLKSNSRRATTHFMIQEWGRNRHITHSCTQATSTFTHTGNSCGTNCNPGMDALQQSWKPCTVREKLKHTAAYITYISSTMVNACAQWAQGWQCLTDCPAHSKLNTSVRTPTHHIGRNVWRNMMKPMMPLSNVFHCHPLEENCERRQSSG